MHTTSGDIVKTREQTAQSKIIHIDAVSHLRGESVYLDDIPVTRGTLFGAAFGSPYAHAHILSLDISVAQQQPGVIKIFTAKDIPGINQIGGIIADEPLLAEDTSV